MRPKQGTFAEASFEKYRKPTRREEFLVRMQRVMPWAELVALIEPTGCLGRRVCRARTVGSTFRLTIRPIARTSCAWKGGLNFLCAVQRIYGGTNEIMKEVIARRM